MGTEETWFPTLAEGDNLLAQVVNNRPRYAAAMKAVEAAIRDQGVLDPEILELCRRRVGQLLPGATSLDSALAEISPARADQLSRWSNSKLFDDRDRVCLGYAEQLLIDAQGVTDEQAAQVIDVIGEGGFLVLTYACGFFETTQRARLILTGRGSS